MAVPLLDLEAHHAPLRDAIDAALRGALDANAFILGPTVARFEEQIAAHLGVPHAVGVSSGTDALVVSLLAAGIGAGHEVVTTPFTFFATAGAILRVGARPVFVDIDPETYNIDASRVPDVTTERTGAVLPVHLFGRAAPMTSLLAWGHERRLTVIEDAAQALGTLVPDPEHGAARPAGALGDFGCFSFFPSKNLGAAGDGGLVVCRDAQRWERVRRLRVHGASRPHHHEEVGGNFRLDALQAAILAVKLPRLESWLERRRANAARYRRLFLASGLAREGAVYPTFDHPVVLPDAAPGHSYNQFVVRAGDRDGLARHLGARAIGHAVYYPRPLHLQPALAELGHVAGAFPEAERAAAEVLALPIYPELSEEQACEVVDAAVSFFGKR